MQIHLPSNFQMKVKEVNESMQESGREVCVTTGVKFLEIYYLNNFLN